MSVIDGIKHDRRCEQADVLVEEPGRCRCRQRAEVRAFCREVGNAQAISYESTARGPVADILDAAVSKSMRSLMTKVTEAQRIPLPMTMHVVSESDAFMDATVMRLVVLTVPTGTELDDDLLNVADDWMRARGLRR